ncbi:MAG: ROK family protein [Acidimicrobiaceae bacterium]|nr:ROK family protein [Acidimicrobiaceae bacterium]
MTANEETLRIGVDIGGTKALGVRLGHQGEVLGELQLPTPDRTGEVVDVIRHLVESLAGPAESPSSIGVGVPALVDGAGVLRFSPHLPRLVGLGLESELRRIWPGAAVWSGNDATAAGWAEHAIGAGRGVDEMLMVTLGTGIGGGIVAGGRIREGARRFAGEFGHMVIDPHGPLCPCGNRGCWERYASGSGLGQLGREAAMAGRLPRVVELAGGDPEDVRGEHVTRAAGEGDPPAVEVMASFAWWLALGLANLATILDPDVVVLGGGLIDAGEVLMGPARRAFAELVEASEARAGLAILPAALGSRAGAVGAGLLAAGERGAG